MKNNELIKWKGSIYRVLAVEGENMLLLDCIKRLMPGWYARRELDTSRPCSEDELLRETGVALREEADLKPGEQKTARERFTIVAGVLPFMEDDRLRKEAIRKVAEKNGVCMQTVRNYVCAYLAYQSLSVLVPKKKESKKRELTADEKCFRWALNKYYFTRHKNSLKTAYTYMLKEKYCDGSGTLLPEYPSYNEFRYFYSKYKKQQSAIISREGIKEYQRNYRPLLGDGVQEFASHVGIGMADSTICDIYLVDQANNVVGRPVLTILTDAYSNGFVMGYSLTWEGGTYSLRDLLLNVVTDKTEWCRKLGIEIEKEQWDSNQLPGVIVTDMGSEYQSDTFAQITELGVTVINLPPLRPELKSIVERSFRMLQDAVKPFLKEHGYVEKDAGARLAPDYRKTACLTIEDYEKIVVRSILYHNSQRILERYPYTEDMIKAGIPPHSNSIFQWGKGQPGCNLIPVSQKRLLMTLLPRSKARFTRKGLLVGGLRYDSKERNFTEDYLKGGEAVAAYHPEAADTVYLLRDGDFIPFHLIESRFAGKSFGEVEAMREEGKAIAREAVQDDLQGRIHLASHVERIVSQKAKEDVNLKEIREAKKRAKKERHKDFREVMES